jgi:antitoxin VapB
VGWTTSLWEQNQRAVAHGSVLTEAKPAPFGIALYIQIVYTFLAEGTAMGKARVFKSGNSQAVRLPKEFRFDVKEVEILRRGNDIVLRIPRRNLAHAFAALASMPEDFMAEGRKDQPPLEREEL